jgi:hypothetical protein
MIGYRVTRIPTPHVLFRYSALDAESALRAPITWPQFSVCEDLLNLDKNTTIPFNMTLEGYPKKSLGSPRK